MRPILFFSLFFVMIFICHGVSAQSHTIKRSSTSSQARNKVEQNSRTRNDLLTNQHRLKGSFYNNKKSWPVEFSIQIKNNGDVNGVYNNISQKTSLNIQGTYYSNESMELYDRNKTLLVSLYRTSTKEFRGTATSGSTTLQVVLTE